MIDQNRVERFAEAIIEKYGVCEEAIFAAAEKFVEQSQYVEKYEKFIRAELGIKPARSDKDDKTTTESTDNSPSPDTTHSL